jgi:hypothetical protein
MALFIALIAAFRCPPLSGVAASSSRFAVLNASSAACIRGWSAALALPGIARPSSVAGSIVPITERRDISLFIKISCDLDFAVRSGQINTEMISYR